MDVDMGIDGHVNSHVMVNCRMGVRDLVDISEIRWSLLCHVQWFFPPEVLFSKAIALVWFPLCHTQVIIPSCSSSLAFSIVHLIHG